MKKNNFSQVLFATVITLCISACQKNAEAPMVEANKQLDPLAMENSVSIISDGPLLFFDEGTYGDKALREFEATTGCIIGFSKLAIDIGDVQKHDLVLAKKNAISDLDSRKQLLPLQMQRIRSIASIDKAFKSDSKVALALQWSPVGTLYRTEPLETTITGTDSVELFEGSVSLQNPDLKLTSINVRDWREVLVENPDLNTLWSFQLPNGKDLKQSADIYQMAITQRSKHPNCSYALMNFLLSPQMQGDLAKEWNTVPVVSSACHGHKTLGEDGCLQNQR